MRPSSLYASVCLTLLSAGRLSRRAYATACRRIASTTPRLFCIWTVWSPERTLGLTWRYRRGLTGVCLCVCERASQHSVTLCTMTMQQVLCANVREDSQEHWCPNSKQSVQCHSGRPMGGMSPFVPCVTFPVIMLACLLKLSLCLVLHIISSHSHFTAHPLPPSLQSQVLSNIWPHSFCHCTHSLSLLFSPQWCERSKQCRRLHLRDLLVAPLQRLTRYPLLLRNIAKRCQKEDETRGLELIAEQVDKSICEHWIQKIPSVTKMLYFWFRLTSLGDPAWLNKLFLFQSC